MDKIGPDLWGFHHEPESSGPHPGESAAGAYSPEFWISHWSDTFGKIKAEPLVLRWSSNNRTVMVLDPGFTMTYGLVPRTIAGGETYWDDVETPEPNIAVVDPPSVYRDFRTTGGRTVVSRDHVQDYLTLRNVFLVQVYYETRSGPVDAAAEPLMVDDQFELEQDDRHISVSRDHDGTVIAQVWGARVIAGPGELPVTSDPLEAQGLLWPGSASPLTRQQARRLRPGERKAYISDEVLSDYADNEEFNVYPLSGSVSFGAQWGVGDCRRVGRDLIELDLRTLYASARPSVVRRWHGFAKSPPARTGSLAVSTSDPNVGKRAESIINSMAKLGGALQDLAAMLNLDIPVEKLIGFCPEFVEYHGWWTQQFIKQIARPFPLNIGKNTFLSRCLELDKVVNEALGKAALRRVVKALGPEDDIKEAGSLKLLDRILRLADFATTEGLNLASDRELVLGQFAAGDKVMHPPIDRLFALSDIRQIAAHRKNFVDVMPRALDRFGFEMSHAASGWGTILDAVYDQVAEDLDNAANLLHDGCS
ncbi:MAG: hypothetical protein MEQ74_13545 [Paracoccus sp.]|nr:hypothetical protein [Paracoccus sp. (in: a-proteobacteria)]